MKIWQKICKMMKVHMEDLLKILDFLRLREVSRLISHRLLESQKMHSLVIGLQIVKVNLNQIHLSQVEVSRVLKIILSNKLMESVKLNKISPAVLVYSNQFLFSERKMG